MIYHRHGRQHAILRVVDLRKAVNLVKVQSKIIFYTFFVPESPTPKCCQLTTYFFFAHFLRKISEILDNGGTRCTINKTANSNFEARVHLFNHHTLGM